MLAVFLLVVVFFGVEATTKLQDGSCLGLNEAEYFRYSPGGYDPSTLNAVTCKNRCGTLFFPYSATVGTQTCLCSKHPKVEQLEPLQTEQCPDDLLSFYHSYIIVDVTGLVLTVSDYVVQVQTPISLEVDVATGENLVYTLNYGDGTVLTTKTPGKLEPHKFYIPGRYTIRLEAIPEDAPDSYRKVDSSEVIVQDGIDDTGVSFTCPPVVKPVEIVTCDFTVTSGVNSTLTVDFAEGTTHTLALPDIVTRTSGIDIPLFPTSEMIQKDSGNAFVIMQQTELTKKGLIYAVRLFVVTPGDFTVVVLRRRCDKGSCAEVKGVASCSAAQSFCNIQDKCLVVGKTACKYKNPGLETDCEISQKTVVSAKTVGHHYITLSTPLEINAGDYIGFHSNKGRVAHRIAGAEEIDDLGGSKAGDQIPTKAVSKTGKIHYFQAIINIPLNLQVQYSFQKIGMHKIAMSLFNQYNAKKISREQKVNVQRPLNGLKLAISPQDVATMKDVTVEATVDGGTDVNVEWDYGDGHHEKELLKDVNRNQKVVKTHVYKHPGIYVIKIKASNPHDKFSDSLPLRAQHPVLPYFTFNTNSPQILPNNISILLHYPKQKNLPTNATAVFHYGDRHNFKWIVPNEGAGIKELFLHNYKAPGIFKIVIKISNVVSSYTIQQDVELAELVTGLSVKLLHDPRVPIDGSTDYAPGFSKDKDKFPVNRDIAFQLSVATGIVEIYLVLDSNNEVVKNNSANVYKTNFTDPGMYNYTVYAWNHVQNFTDPVMVTLFTMDPVEGLEVFDNVNATEEDEDKYFEVTFDAIGSDTCLLVNYDDDTNLLIYGPELICSMNATTEEATWEGELTNPLILEHLYILKGRFEAYFRAFNDISESIFTLPFVISNITCKAPELSLRNRVLRFDQTEEIIRSVPVVLYSYTLVKCNDSSETTRKWKGFRLNETLGHVEEEVDLSVLDSYRKSMLFIPPFFLQRGTYRFIFQVNVTAFIMIPPLFYSRSVDTHVTVIPSPVIVQMSDGAQSRIVRGWGQSLKLEPGIYSIDPDDINNKNFTITWFCRRVPGEFINRNLSDELQNVSSPIYDRTTLETPLGEEPDNGGCFGKGPGLLDVTEGAVYWNTTNFRRPNATYEISVRVDLSDREPSWGAIQIVILDQIPPSISVRCQTEKLCYPHDPIGQKINPVRVGLIGLCTEGCDNDLIFEWQIYGVDGEGNETYLQEAVDFVVGANEQKMALVEKFFKEYYPTYGDFIAKLSAENQYGQKGESDLFLHINKPPEGGNCTVYPEEGKALIDVFTASCMGWLDPEGSKVEYFAFWITDPNNVTMYQSTGPDGDCQMILPYGVFQLGVDIKDKEGAMTKINITTVALGLPTKEEYDNFMNTRQLDQVEAAGDQARMNQVSQALSSLMGVRLPADENSTSSEEMSTEPPELSDEDNEELAKTRLRMIKSVGSVMNTDTLSHLEQIGSALTAIAGRGDGIDNDGKEEVIRLLNKTVALASDAKLEAPQQLLDFCMYAVGTMGGIVSRISDQLVNGVVLPTDREKALDFEYDVQAPLYGEEEKDSPFDGTIPLKEALSIAVIERERINAEGQVKSMVDLTIKLVLVMLKNIVVGEEPMEFASPSGLAFTISMFRGGTLTNKSIEHGDAIYIFPDVCDILGERGCIGNETLGVMAVSWPAILQSYGDGVDLLSTDSKTLQLIMLDENMNIMKVENSTGLFSIIVPRGKPGEESPLPSPTYVLPSIKWNEELVYHQFIVEKADSAVNIELTLNQPDIELLLFIKHREKPLLNSYDLMLPLTTTAREVNGTYEIFLDNEIVRNRTGFFYLGIIEANSTADDEAIPEDPLFDTEVNFTNGETIREFSTNYSLRIYTSGCYFFNYDLKIWSAAGCVVHDANALTTHCKCNHLTSFGGGFFISPNTVDFSYVFANAGFADNITIYMTIIVTLLLYVMVLIWARYQDKKDLEKLGATPLPDNNVDDKYLYEINIFTGNKDGAGTDSKVQFILSGDDDETEVRKMEDTKRKIFRKGGMDSFVMAVPRPLGRMNYMRIWHDNSGKGKFRSWFLSFVVVRDVQTGEKFEFISNKWFAVEKDDGSIDRLLPVAGKEEATDFSHLFNVTTQKNLSDGHLWFSVFMRPPKSRFTRAQRISSCVAMLYLSMLVNAMWYGQVPSKPSSSAISMGPLSLSPEQIGVGVMSNFIVFPPTFLMITLFRKSRLRQLRPSHITEAVKKQNLKLGKPSRPTSADSTTTLVHDMFPQLEEKKRKPMKKKKKFLFPWWCRYVAWALCLISIFVSVFFLWAYGVQFGDEKTRKWVTSLLISFFTSILITQPIKVFMVAMIVSSLCKSVDNGGDDADDDEEEPELAPNEEWLHKEAMAQAERRKQMYRPPDFESLEEAKQERLKELHMMAILKEIFGYMMFIWILTVLSFGNRDPSAYLLRENLKNAFIKEGDSSLDFTQITSPAGFYTWTREALIPELIVGKWYNGDQPFALRGFLDDRVNRLMGYGVLRQVRIKPNTCRVEKIMRNLTTSCRGRSSLLDEDKTHYQAGWKEPSTDNTTRNEYYYRRAKELNGLPFWALTAVYGGGGYVYPLRGTREFLTQEMFRLETSDWVDGGTRAVFVEFSVYNAQVNLFGIITIVAEFQPGGGVIPFYRIEAIRLMRYHQGFGLFVMLTEITYVIFIIYFTVRELKSFLNIRMDYFRSYWNWAELMVIGLSYGAIVMYFYRTFKTNKILKYFEKTHGNGYVKMQYVSSVDEIFGFLMAFLMFISILKFIRLLRFNKRMGILYQTLSLCSKDLTSFFVVFGVIFLAFVQFHYLIYGTNLKGFSSFVTAAETSFSMVRGVFDFDEICLTAPILGPLSFFVFSLITSIILLNIFITLIISAFQSVKGDVEQQSSEYEITSFIFNKFKSFIGLNPNNGKKDKDKVTTKKSLDDQIHEFPEKVDKLLSHINNFYFDGQLDLSGKKALKGMYKEKEPYRSGDTDFYGRRRFGSRQPTAQRKSSVFEWSIIDD